MLDDIKDGTIAAIKEGQRLGERIQRDRAINSWADYASDLEKIIAQKERAMAEKDSKIEMLVEKVDTYKNAYDRLENTAYGIQADLKVERAKIEEMKAAEAKHKQFVATKITRIERAWQAQSANVAAYEELYKLLVKEIETEHDPADFDSLNFAKRTEIVKEVWEKFAKTGKTYYHPDLNFSYQKSGRTL